MPATRNRTIWPTASISNSKRPRRPARPRSLAGRRGRLLFEIEAVGHIVRFRVTGIQRRQPKDRLTEFDQTHVRMERLGDVAPLGIGTQDQATDARSVTELGLLIGRWPPLRRPLLGIPGLDVIVPAPPIVPGDKDDAVRPQAAPDDRVHL